MMCSGCVWPYIQLAGSCGFDAASSRAERATARHYVRDPDALPPANGEAPSVPDGVGAYLRARPIVVVVRDLR
jgi:hypothetical protein